MRAEQQQRREIDRVRHRHRRAAGGERQRHLRRRWPLPGPAAREEEWPLEVTCGRPMNNRPAPTTITAGHVNPSWKRKCFHALISAPATKPKRRARSSRPSARTTEPDRGSRRRVAPPGEEALPAPLPVFAARRLPVRSARARAPEAMRGEHVERKRSDQPRGFEEDACSAGRGQQRQRPIPRLPTGGSSCRT